MRVVSVINYKGGVGKTTVTANLGAELAHRGHRVLILDLDAQASLTFSFIQPDVWQRDLAEAGTIKSWFDSFATDQRASLRDLIVRPHSANSFISKGKLDIIPSHLGLINVDLELATELGGASLQQSKRNYLKVHRRLSEGLADLSDEEYDVLLIDCPPNFNVVTKTAIVASESLLIPAKPDYLSTLGIDYLQRSLNQLVSDYNEYAELDSATQEINPSLLGVVFTMVSFYGGQPISTMRPFIVQTEQLGVPIFESMVRENKSLFGDAPQYGVPVVLTRQSPGTYGNIVSELEDLATEFSTKMGLA